MIACLYLAALHRLPQGLAVVVLAGHTLSLKRFNLTEGPSWKVGCDEEFNGILVGQSEVTDEFSTLLFAANDISDRSSAGASRLRTNRCCLLALSQRPSHL